MSSTLALPADQQRPDWFDAMEHWVIVAATSVAAKCSKHEPAVELAVFFLLEIFTAQKAHALTPHFCPVFVPHLVRRRRGHLVQTGFPESASGLH